MLGEAKWTAKEDIRQGVLGTTSQMQMRRDSLAAEAAARGKKVKLVALGVVLAQNLEPPPPVADGVSTRIIEWQQLADYSDHPRGDEFRRYYEWKRRHLQSRLPRPLSL